VEVGQGSPSLHNCLATQSVSSVSFMKCLQPCRTVLINRVAQSCSLVSIVSLFFKPFNYYIMRHVLQTWRIADLLGCADLCVFESHLLWALEIGVQRCGLGGLLL